VATDKPSGHAIASIPIDKVFVRRLRNMCGMALRCLALEPLRDAGRRPMARQHVSDLENRCPCPPGAPIGQVLTAARSRSRTVRRAARLG